MSLPRLFFRRIGLKQTDGPSEKTLNYMPDP